MFRDLLNLIFKARETVNMHEYFFFICPHQSTEFTYQNWFAFMVYWHFIK